MKVKQKISQLAQTYTQQEKSNIWQFNKESLIQRFQQETQPQEYFDSYQMLFWLAILLAFTMQFASALSAYNYLDLVFIIKITHTDLRFILVIASLLIIEIFKYRFYNITLQKAFARPRQFEPFMISLTLGISIFSFYASVSGGGKYGINAQKPLIAQKLYNQKIQDKEQQIQSIQNSQAYKEVKWLGDGQTALILNSEGLDQIQKRENELSKIKQEKAQKLQKINQENSLNRKRYEYAFGSFELIFILCQLFIWQFKRNAAQDREISEQLQNTNLDFKSIPKAETVSTIKQKPTSHSEPLNFKKINKIGFQKDEDTFIVSKPKYIFKVNNQVLQSPQNTSSNAPHSQIQSEFEVNKAKLAAEKEEFEAIREKFEATLQTLQIKNAKYLKKYETPVKLIMQREAEQKSDSAIKAEVTSTFNICESTYYGIKRILNNPTQARNL